ncbi:MAG TPA: metallophosphoesterase [Trueperaceae bacterium]|nr:metallophosphoesterase [Trueperaceae bacterium]
MSLHLPRPVAAGVIALLVAALCGTSAFAQTGATADTVTVAAAGDIACEPGSQPSLRACQQAATAKLVQAMHPDAVLAVGDLQYPTGLLTSFQGSYDESWGAFRAITYPVPGNHEYYNLANGYFDYWGSRVGTRDESWYSFDLGGWHILALDSNCPYNGGCQEGSPEVSWIEADLAAHPSTCALAFFHHPRFSSGPHGDNEAMAPMWRALQAGGVDVILTGHDHDYERFALQDADGRLDPAHGIREFVVGTGGAPQYFVLWRRAHSQALQVGTFGVLKLTLQPDAYGWSFVPIAGETYSDSGSHACHAPPSP